LLLFLALALGAPACAQTPAPGRFEGWATAIISADWRDGRGRPIAAFDNARRDLVAAFQAAGLPEAGMVDFSLRTDVPDPVTPGEALAGVRANAARGQAGCLLYFTSHGSPDGIVFGDEPPFAPLGMVGLVREACGARPTVVVVSACYSGIFVDSLRAPNRMILTAARRDRTSFGCGADDRYPWFDGCVLESLPTASDFLALAAAARACVSAKEAELGATPPSEPQLFVGSEMQLRLPTLRFIRAAG
jgi:hypothetical protein